MKVDRLGNPHAPNLPYARGNILAATEDDFQKLQLAWSLIREKGPRNIFIFTGLEHAMPPAAEELEFADDEIGPALSYDRLKARAHLRRRQCVFDQGGEAIARAGSAPPAAARGDRVGAAAAVMPCERV